MPHCAINPASTAITSCARKLRHTANARHSRVNASTNHRNFDRRHEPIALLAQAEPGRFVTDPTHIHAHKRVLIEREADWLPERARSLG